MKSVFDYSSIKDYGKFGHFCRGCNQCDTGSEAYFGNGTKLTVLDPEIEITPPTVKILPPSTKECKKKKTLVCVATDFYPDHVTVSWKVDGDIVTAGVVTDNAALQDEGTKKYTITSRLKVQAKEWNQPTKKFDCIVSFFDGKTNTTTEVPIYGVSGEGTGTGTGTTKGKYVRVTVLQTAKMSYIFFLAKSSFYGLFLMALLWRIQGQSKKQYN